MSLSVPALSGIAQRISAIEHRLGVDARAESSVQVLESEPFDAFGEVYQQALQSSEVTPPAATPAPVPVAPPAGWQVAGDDFTQVPNNTFPILATTVYAPPADTPSSEASPSQSAAIAGLAGAPGERPIGGYGKMPVPTVLAPYGNGRIPADALSPIAQSGHRLLGPAATAWNNLVATAAADGIELRITDSYRSYENQVSLAERKGLYSQGGLAATPGTSNHGWGLAVDADVTDPATLAWVRENGPRFGWVEAVPREPWHWEFRPDQV